MNKVIQQSADCIIKEMIQLSESIYKEPELGYKEFKTAQKVMEKLEQYHIPYEKNVAFTGIVSILDSGKPGPNIGLICELDAVPTIGHPYANEEDYGAHTCGHYAQVGVMLSVFCTLKESGVINELGGKVTFIATPAEEFCDFDYRKSLIEKGKISFMSGKQEMIHLGVFDTIDVILSCHTMGTGMPYDAELDAGLNGFICKRAVFYGKAAHAGSYPSEGINALNAANLAMTGIHFLRETFKEEDKIRVHFIMSEGGQTVNTVPKQTKLDMYVRAKTIEAIQYTDKKVMNCLKAGALAIGCTLEVVDTPGYFPLKQDRNLTKVIEKNISRYISKDRILRDNHGFASGDMGDLSMLFPIVEIGTGGFSGMLHGCDFQTEDETMAYTIPTYYFIDSVIDLLKEEGQEAYAIQKSFQPVMTKEDYFKTLKSFNKISTFPME